MLTKDQKEKLTSMCHDLVIAAEKSLSDSAFMYASTAVSSITKKLRFSRRKWQLLSKDEHDENLESIIKKAGKNEFYYREACDLLAEQYGCSVRACQGSDGLLSMLFSIRRVIKSVDEKHPKKWNKYQFFSHRDVNKKSS